MNGLCGIVLTLALSSAFIPLRMGSEPESVRIDVPAAASFQVSDVTTSTASDAPSSISFDLAQLESGRVVRISVIAESDLTPPGGSSIPASKIAWTTSNVANGIGINGTLSRSVYAPVFEGTVGATSGRVDISWTLAAPGDGVLAGTHQVTLRWKVEAITP